DSMATKVATPAGANSAATASRSVAQAQSDRVQLIPTLKLRRTCIVPAEDRGSTRFFCSNSCVVRTRRLQQTNARPQRLAPIAELPRIFSQKREEALSENEQIHITARQIKVFSPHIAVVSNAGVTLV